MSETVQERVYRVISTSRRIPRKAIRPDSTFEELGIDSLDRLNILFELESEFGIEINDEEAKIVTKISEMVNGIDCLVQQSAKLSPG